MPRVRAFAASCFVACFISGERTPVSAQCRSQATMARCLALSSFSSRRSSATATASMTKSYSRRWSKMEYRPLSSGRPGTFLDSSGRHLARSQEREQTLARLHDIALPVVAGFAAQTGSVAVGSLKAPPLRRPAGAAEHVLRHPSQPASSPARCAIQAPISAEM